MTTSIVIAFIVMGFILLIIEIFFVPGFSVPGIVGLAMIGYGIFKAKAAYGPAGAFITIAVSAIAAVVLIITSLKSRTVKSIGLAYNEKEAKAVDDYSFLIGKEGVAHTKLRPSGTAMINNKRYDVVTDGEYIESNSPIMVRAVEGTRIIVAAIDKH